MSIFNSDYKTLAVDIVEEMFIRQHLVKKDATLYHYLNNCVEKIAEFNFNEIKEDVELSNNFITASKSQNNPDSFAKVVQDVASSSCRLSSPLFSTLSQMWECTNIKSVECPSLQKLSEDFSRNKNVFLNEKFSEILGVAKKGISNAKLDLCTHSLFGMLVNDCNSAIENYPKIIGGKLKNLFAKADEIAPISTGKERNESINHYDLPLDNLSTDRCSSGYSNDVTERMYECLFNVLIRLNATIPVRTNQLNVHINMPQAAEGNEGYRFENDTEDLGKFLFVNRLIPIYDLICEGADKFAGFCNSRYRDARKWVNYGYGLVVKGGDKCDAWKKYWVRQNGLNRAIGNSGYWDYRDIGSRYVSDLNDKNRFCNGGRPNYAAYAMGGE